MDEHSRQPASAERLGEEVFALLQGDQGYFYVSDGEGGGMTNAQLYARLRGRLAYGRRAVRKLRDWLKAHNELYGELERAMTPTSKRP